MSDGGDERTPMTFSTNDRAERLMGRRLTAQQEQEGVLPIDMPCELGYQCPVHKRAWDEGLQWSEYRSFLWCEDCDSDYPTALCVPIDVDPSEARDDWNVGPEAAVKVYLDTVEAAVTRGQGDTVIP